MRRWTVGLGAAFVWALTGAAAASAHTELVHAHPDMGARLAHAPTSVQLRFTEAVDAGQAAIQVQDARGRRVERGPVFHPHGREEVLAVRVAPGIRGSLAVGWRVVSDDGHPEAGAINFAVAAPGAGAGAAPAPKLRAEPRATAALGSAARAGHALAVTVALGVVLFLLLAWPRGDATPGGAAPRRAMQAAAGRLVRAVALAGLALAVAGAWLEGAAIAGVGPLDVGAAGSALRALDARAGCGWGIAIVAWVALLVRMGPRARLRTDVPTILAVVLLAAAPVLCGHADGIVLPVAATHVVAVAIWVGGLPALLLAGAVLRRSGLSGPVTAGVARATTGRYGRLALPAAGAVVATGTIQSLVRLGAPLDLLTTGYGRLLALKIVGVLGLLALGAANRQWLLPRLRGTTAAAATRMLRRTVAAELAIAVGVFAATGILTGAAPPA